MEMWEYDLRDLLVSNFLEELRRLGRDRWEVCSVWWHEGPRIKGDKHSVLIKRKILEPEVQH